MVIFEDENFTQIKKQFMKVLISSGNFAPGAVP